MSLKCFSKYIDVADKLIQRYKSKFLAHKEKWASKKLRGIDLTEISICLLKINSHQTKFFPLLSLLFFVSAYTHTKNIHRNNLTKYLMLHRKSAKVENEHDNDNFDKFLKL